MPTHSGVVHANTSASVCAHTDPFEMNEHGFQLFLWCQVLLWEINMKNTKKQTTKLFWNSCTSAYLVLCTACAWKAFTFRQLVVSEARITTSYILFCTAKTFLTVVIILSWLDLLNHCYHSMVWLAMSHKLKWKKTKTFSCFVLLLNWSMIH